MRFITVFAILGAATAYADPTSELVATPRPSKTIGVDGALALPTGTWGDATGFGFGALARFEMPLAPALAFSARAGYIQHLGKDAPGAAGGFGGKVTSSASEVPVLGGVRYGFVKKPTSEIYGAAELGFVISRVSVDAGGMSMSDSKTNLGMSLGGGYRAGKLDLRGGLLFPDLGHVGDAMAVMATVGYDLTSL